MRITFYDFCAESGNENLLREWDAELNGDLTPQAVSHGSTREVWWRCQKGHSWKSAVYARTAGKGCPYCGGRRVISGFNDLASQNGELAAQWDAVKNAPLRPEEVTPGSHRKVWWRCRKGHRWQAEIKSRHSGKGCPVCAGRTAPGITDLKTVAPAAAVRWDPELNGRDTPDRVSAGNSRQAWWRCEKGHFWRSPIRFQSGGERGCPYCMGMKAWYGFNDLETVAPELAAQWDSEKNKELTPRQVTAFSNKKHGGVAHGTIPFRRRSPREAAEPDAPTARTRRYWQAITIYPPDFRSLAGNGTPRSTAIWYQRESCTGAAGRCGGNARMGTYGKPALISAQKRSVRTAARFAPGKRIKSGQDAMTA